MAEETLDVRFALVVDDSRVLAHYEDYSGDYDWYAKNDPEHNYPGPKQTYEEYRQDWLSGIIEEASGAGLDGWWRLERIDGAK